MNADASPLLPYNGAMLRWAREWRGRSVEEAAARVKVPVERLLNWEEPESDDKPTVRQARELAAFYDRAFMEFFYDGPPRLHESGLIPDYRLHRGVSDPHGDRELLTIQHWAEMQRSNALDLFEDVEEPVPAFPSELTASISDDVEQAAMGARDALQFSFTEQRRFKYKDRQNLPALLRDRMEAVGVLVLRENELSKFGVSGMTIAEFPLPVIVYAVEAPSRSAFTLMHEFAHLVLRESAISGGGRARDGATYERKVERWCDRFAAAFLIPKDELEQLRARPQKPVESIDDETLAAIANHFKVSQHAMLLRLVDLSYVSSDYYWTVKRPQFLAQEAGWRSKGISKIWASRVWNQLGHLYTGLVLEALGTGKILPHQAQTYFGVRNPTHLTAIRQEFGGG